MVCKFATWFSIESVNIKLNNVFVIYPICHHEVLSCISLMALQRSCFKSHYSFAEFLYFHISSNDEYLDKEHNYISCSIFLIALPRALNSQYS